MSATIAEAAAAIRARRGLTVPAEQRDALADYLVLVHFDVLRSSAYGDMAHARRGRELDRLGDELIASGVTGLPDLILGHVEHDLTADELRAAFERVARPRIDRIAREGYRSASRYTRATLETWARVAREFGAVPS